jgi:hypothetical protein
LNLSNEKLVSNFAFKCNLYRYSVGLAALTETSLTPRLTVSAAPARVAYVLLRHGSPAPTAVQVLAGVDGRGLSLAHNRPRVFKPHLSCLKASLLPLKRPR